MSNISALTDLFESFDTSKKGYISKEDFIESVELLVGECGRGEDALLFADFDEHSSDRVSLPEFIAFYEALN